MSEKKFLEQSTQNMLNIVEALQFYKNNAIKPKYRNLIDEQLIEIGKQLKLQNINILFENNNQRFNFGDLIKYDNQDAIIVGMSDEDSFIKISVIENNKFKIIEIPICLIEREK